MEFRKFLIRESCIILIGELLCSAAMIGVFVLTNHFNRSVLSGVLIGAFLAALNFFFMGVSITVAADKASHHDVRGGKAMLRFSFFLRLFLLFILFFAFAKSGLCDPVSLAVPLVFLRPIITVSEFFRKSGDTDP